MLIVNLVHVKESGSLMESDSKLPRRERERLRHRQEILAAAHKLIEERGIEGLTVDDVAREAEFAVGSIYRHFRSKEELIEALLTELIEPLFEEIEALPGSGLGFEQMIEEATRLVDRNRLETLPLLQIFLASPVKLPVPGTPSGELLRKGNERIFAAISQLIAAGQSEGLLPKADQLPMVLSLIGLIHSFTSWTILGPFPLGEDVGVAVRRSFLDGWRSRGDTP